MGERNDAVYDVSCVVRCVFRGWRCVCPRVSIRCHGVGCGVSYVGGVVMDDVRYLSITITGTCWVCGATSNNVERDEWHTFDDYASMVCATCANDVNDVVLRYRVRDRLRDVMNECGVSRRNNATCAYDVTG